MAESNRLIFAEKLLLLSYIEDKARISYRASGNLQYACVAASLLELCIRKNIMIDGKKVVLLDMSSTGDTFLDEMLTRISDKYDPKSATYWTSALSHRITGKLLNRLIDKGIFWEDYVSSMFILTRKCYRLSDTREYRQLHDSLRDTLLSDKERFTAEGLIIAAMLKNCDALSLHLDKEELKRCKGRVKDILKDEELLERVMGSNLKHSYKAVNKALSEVKAASAAT